MKTRRWKSHEETISRAQARRISPGERRDASLGPVESLKTWHLTGCQSRCRQGNNVFACGPELCSHLGGYCQAQRKGYELLSGGDKGRFSFGLCGKLVNFSRRSSDTWPSCNSAWDPRVRTIFSINSPMLAQAVITKYHRLCGLNNRDLFSPSSGG